MNRRMALFLTLMMGGLVPRGLRAQGTSRRTSTKEPRPGPRSRRRRDVPSSGVADEKEPEVEAGDQDEPTPNLPAEPGQAWRRYDIGHYTSLAQNQSLPQNAIVEWIFRRTGSADWHGDKVAVLGASRSQLHASTMRGR